MATACGDDLGAIDLFTGGDPDATSSLDASVDSPLVANDASSNADTSTAADVATPPDAASDAAQADGAVAPVEGGLPSNPGAITCGTTSCAVTQAFCCARTGGPDTCETSGGACSNSGERSCDEAADCPLNNVCCYDSSTTPPSSSCHTDCTGGGGLRTQACRTLSECLSGACAVHACTDGRTVETCAPIAGLCP